jgi:hypothetical protein
LHAPFTQYVSFYYLLSLKKGWLLFNVVVAGFKEVLNFEKVRGNVEIGLRV